DRMGRARLRLAVPSLQGRRARDRRRGRRHAGDAGRAPGRPDQEQDVPGAVAGAERPHGARARGGGLGAPTAASWGGARHDQIVPYYAPIYDDLVAQLAPRPGERLLDVATGTGEVAFRAARTGAEVTGLDITPELLDVARSKADAHAIRFDEGDAQALPYVDGSFDVVASNFGVIFALGRDAVASELARVCRRGGRPRRTAWGPE